MSLFFFTGCSLVPLNNFYQKTFSFQNQEWNSNQRISFDFSVSDTSALYNVFLVLRHTDAYHYNNIWLDITSISQGDTAREQQLNLKLGDNKKWLGTETDDIIEHRILLTQNPIKFRKQNYKFILQQIMREEKLQELIDAGIRVEKVI